MNNLLRHHGLMMAQGGGGVSFDAYVASLLPLWWTKCADLTATYPLCVNEIGADGIYTNTTVLEQPSLYTDATALSARLSDGNAGIQMNSSVGPAGSMPGMTLFIMLKVATLTSYHHLQTRDGDGSPDRVWQWRMQNNISQFIKIKGGVEVRPETTPLAAGVACCVSIGIDPTGAGDTYFNGTKIGSGFTVGAIDYGSNAQIITVGIRPFSEGNDKTIQHNIGWGRKLSDAEQMQLAVLSGFA